jgi:hypothetical protein
MRITVRPRKPWQIPPKALLPLCRKKWIRNLFDSFLWRDKGYLSSTNNYQTQFPGFISNSFTVFRVFQECEVLVLVEVHTQHAKKGRTYLSKTRHSHQALGSPSRRILSKFLPALGLRGISLGPWNP